MKEDDTQRDIGDGRIGRATPSIDRRRFLRTIALAAGTIGIGTAAAGTASAGALDMELDTQLNDPGIRESVLSTLNGTDVRIPNTNEIEDDAFANLVSTESVDAKGGESLTGHTIDQVTNPIDDLKDGLGDLKDAAQKEDDAAIDAAATEIIDILRGETQGRIYDGFRRLHYSRGGILDEHVDGEYKMKRLEDNGVTTTGIQGDERTVWEVTVNMLWFGENFDADTALLRVPHEAHPNDHLRIRYRIYSLVQEEHCPWTALNDFETSLQFPFKGLDAVWKETKSKTVTEHVVDHPPIGMLRGIYSWGWREHPPRVQWIQPVREVKNAAGDVVLEPGARSFAVRSRNLSLNDIGDAAPQKKMYTVAKAAVDGTATPAEIVDMLKEPDVDPRGTYTDWVKLAKNRNKLPPEARDVLESEGIDSGFGPYRYVTVYANNEMYGNGPDGSADLKQFLQGDQFEIKVINLDDHTHYYRAVDFGPELTQQYKNFTAAGGSQTFEICNFKPFHGAPKAVEMQWRAGWGFRPHFDVIQQDETFPRNADQEGLESFTDGGGDSHLGYRFSTTTGDNTWRFDPPKKIIGTAENPSEERLEEGDGTEGLLVGRRTAGFGVAKMPEGDLSDHHPLGLTNMDVDGDGDEELIFPKFLRNPDDKGGDIIPPTPLWKPFLFLSPENGTLYKNGTDGSDGYRIDDTYAQGKPVPAGGDVTADIEAPRAAGQILYQFDPLFHDNAIFSPHME